MDRGRVFIVGDSLFAETLARMLDESGRAAVVGVAPTPEVALPGLAPLRPDALIVASARGSRGCVLDPLLAAHPGLPILLADPTAGKMSLVESQQVETRGSDLLAVIAGLPRRIG